MSLREFLKQTRLLLEQGVYESRRAMRAQSEPAERALQVSKLEERVLMSASPVAVVAEAPEAADAAQSNNSSLNDRQVLDIVADSVLPPQEETAIHGVDAGAEATGIAAREQTLELVFVDSSVSDLDRIIADLRSQNAVDDSRTLEILVLDSQKDGIAQITSALLTYNGIDGIHVVSHGSDGQVQLGSTTLSLDNLDTYRSAISAWQYSLADEADLLLYGCNLAATADGQELMNQIAAVCQCEVAASEDLTGNSELGGDWDLEYVTGDIETAIAVSREFQSDWNHVLNVNIDAASSGSTPDQGSVTVSHTTSGANRLMLVGISMEPEGDSVTSVTYNGVLLSRVGVEENPGGKARVEIWQLVAPQTGTHDVVVNLSGTSHMGVVVGVQTYSDVNQTDPTYGFGSSSGNSTAAAASVTGSLLDDLVFGVVQSHKGASITPGTGQSEIWDIADNNANGAGTIQKSDGSPLITDWTVNNEQWSAAAITVQADTNSVQSNGLFAVQDAYIQLQNPATNDGTSGSMTIDRESTDVQRALVQFDLSSVPSGSTVTAATLELQATGIDGLLTIDAYQVQQSWSETTVTWNQRSSGTNWSTAGGAFDATPLDSISTNQTGIHSFDVTSLVQDWVDGAAQNYGLLIGSPDGGGNRTVTYDSREGSVKPRLVIHYENNNSPPTDISPAISNVDEHTDTTGGYSVATLTTTDPDIGDTFSYFIVGGADVGQLTIGGLGSDELILTDGALNFENKPTYSVTVRTTDSQGATFDKTVTVNVNDLNDAPVLDNSGTTSLSTVLQGSTDPAGDLVAAIIASSGGDRITDVDSGAVEGIAVTAVDNTNGTWEYSTNGGGTWTAFGAVSDANAVVLSDASNDRVRFVPGIGYVGSATMTFRAWDRSDGNSSGTAGVNTTINDGATAYSAATESAGINVESVEVLLWMSTTQDVGPAYSLPDSGVAGLPSWSESSVIGMGDPNLSFGAGSTSGTFGLVSDFNTFADDGQTSLTGLHYVTSDITVAGAGISGSTVDLLAEDLLFIAGTGDTLTSTAVGAPAGWSNSIIVSAGDVYAFRAENSGDYSSGYFRLVMNGAGVATTQAITLVEQSVTVGGDVVLEAGDFLFAQSGVTRENNIYWYDTSADTAVLLIDGNDINISGNKVLGLELIETGANVGGIALSTGDILVAVESAGAVGDNSLAVTTQDVFALNVTATTFGSGTAAATASLLFDGDGNVNFDDPQESVDALSLIVVGTGSNQAPVIGNSGTPVIYTENGPPVVIDGTITVADADSSDFDGGLLSVSISAGGTIHDRISIYDQGTAIGQIGVSGSDVTFNFGAGAVTIGSYTGGIGGVTPLVVNLNSSANATAAQALMRNIVFSNTSDNPIAGVRTIDFALTDGDGGTSTTISQAATITAVSDAPVAVNDSFGLDFDGVDDYVAIADDFWLVLTNTMTMEAWINPDASANANRMIINKEGEYEVALFSDDRIYWAFANSDPGWGWHDTGYTVTNGEWTHIAVTYDNGTVNTFVNGQVVDTYNGSGPIGDVYSGMNELRIGGRSNVPAGKFFDGRIDDVRIWNTARTQNEIQSNLDTVLTGLESGLAGHWSFTEGTGSAVADSTIHANNGTLIDGGLGTAGPQWVGYQTNEDSAITVTATAGLVSNDIDIDGDTLLITQVNGVVANVGALFALPSGANLTANADGSFTYDPNGAWESLTSGQRTTDSFTYQIDDGNGGTDLATATITITGVNDAPVLATNTGSTVVAGSTSNIIATAMLEAGDFDDDSSGLTYTITALPLNGTIYRAGFVALALNDTFTQTDVDSGNVTYDHDGSETAGDSFGFSLADGGEDGVPTASGTFTITVLPTNDFSPVITSDGGGASAVVNVAENSTAVTTVIATDADLPAQTLTYSISGGADAGKFTIVGSTGVLTFVAAPDYEAPTDVGADNVYDVIVQVSDGTLTDSQAISVTVTNQTITSVTATGASTIAAGSNYTLNLSADEDATGWTINWGDGTITTEAGVATSAIHVYSNVGMTFNIVVSATDGSGTFTESNLLTASDWNNSVFLLDGNTGLVNQTLSAGLITRPSGVEVGPDGDFYVTSSANTILRYDGTTGALVGTFISAGAGGLNSPFDLAFGADGHLYVASYGTDEILRYDGTTGAFIDAFVATGSGGMTNPSALDFGPDGNLYVSSWFNGIVHRFNGTTGAYIDDFADTEGFGTTGFAFGPDGNLYVGRANVPQIFVFDQATGTKVGQFAPTGGPYDLAFGPDGYLYAALWSADVIERFDISTQTSAGVFATNATSGIDGPWGFEFTPDQQVTITPAANLPPVVDLNGTNDVGLDFAVTFTEDGGPVAVADTDALVSDVDSTTFQSLSISIPVAPDGASERFSVGGYTFSYGVSDVVSRTVGGTSFELDFDGSGFNIAREFGGLIPAADMDLLIRSITYENTSQNPTGGIRTLQFVAVDDIGAAGAASNSVITVNPVNDAPTITTTGSAPAYTENDPATVIDAGLTVSDPDNVTLDSVVIRITGNFTTGQDVLAFTDQLGITGSWNAGTGILTLSGSTTASNYQIALRTVTYQNTSDNPNTAPRTISFTADDGIDSGVAATRNISITAVNDAPTGVPTITGIVTEDQILTADTSGISDADGLGAFSYQWLRNGSSIGGATGSTYLLGDADVGTLISAEVSYTDGNSTAEGPLTSIQTAAVANVNDAPTGAVTIDNMTPDQGDTLTAGNTLADADGLSGPITYQWQRNGIDISGATSGSYATVVADVGTVITVVASYTDDHGTPESVSSAATATVGNVNDPPTGAVTISGIPTEDQLLTASNTLADADGMGVVSYQWRRNGSDISGATGNTYTLADADVGSTISVIASYTDGGGTPETVSSSGVGPIANVNDAPLGGPTITGTVTEDQTLTADTSGISDNDGLGSFSYQWLRNGSAIGGAIGSTYLLGDADVGTQISVEVRYTDGWSTVEGPLTSAQTAAVANVNDTPVGVPTITGTATEDQLLTADTSGISDADGLGTFGYQWLRNGSAIGGATGSTYLLGDIDVGTQISVRVTYTDGHGTNETVTSAQTASVTNVNDEETLTTNTGLTVNEGDNGTVISQSMLETTDVDNTSAQLTYTLTTATGTGTLRLSGTVLASGNTFTQADINAGRLTYDHNDAEVFTDGFAFAVNDGSGQLTSGSFAITIIPVNDNNPEINSNGGTATAVLNVAENSAAVTTVTATDSDLPVQTLGFAIVGGTDSTRFLIDTVSGELTFATAPDFETAADSDSDNVYEVVVEVSDGLGRMDQQTILVTVTDVDEFDVSAITDTDSATDAVSENALVGTTVGITASADDGDDSDTVTFSLDDSAGGLFAIDSVSGVVTVSGALNRESAAAHSIIVRATSTDTSTTTQSYTITINDLNDNAPIIAPSQSFNVSENAAVTTSVGTVSATDVDIAGTLQNWTIVSGNSDAILAIDPTTGQITVADAANLDFETTGSYTLTLTVSDGTNTSALQTITISVVDENDAPVFVPAATMNISENSSNGSVAGSVAATDQDAADVLTYSIVAGTPGQPFTVHSVSGLISVADVTQLDFESATSFAITVRVTDLGGLTDTQVVTINVDDVNETPLDLVLTGTTVNENAANGTLVGTIAGSDPDAGDSLTYSLSNNAAGRFAIDLNSGQITVANSSLLDFEAGTAHVIAVRTTDSGGLNFDESFTIVLNDVNETPEALNDDVTGDQFETLVVATEVITGNDFDVDGDTLSVVLISGPTHGTLTLNGDGSFVYVPSGAFSGSDEFTYYVTDGSLNSAPATVAINIRTTLSGSSTGSDSSGNGDSGTNSGSSSTADDSQSDSEDNDSIGDNATTENNAAGNSIAGASDGSRAEQKEQPGEGFGTHDSTLEILRRASGDMSIMIFLDEIPETDLTEDSGRERRRLDNDADNSHRELNNTFLFAQVTTTNPFFGMDYGALKPHSAVSSNTSETFSDFVLDKIVVGTTATVSTSVSVGYVIWMLRGGSLLTTFLSSLPAWQSFDPLPVLESFEEQNTDDDDHESLASMVSGE